MIRRPEEALTSCIAELAQILEDQLCRNRWEIYRSTPAIAPFPQGGARGSLSAQCTPTYAGP
jgi:hypothetical protein